MVIDSQRFPSDSEHSAMPPHQLSEDIYVDENSIDEVDAALNNLDDDEDFAETEHSRSQWSPGSYSSTGPTFSSATGTFTYSRTYSGSPSFVNLPTFSPRSPFNQPPDPLVRLSRITERTEESRPSSAAFSSPSRPFGTISETHRRSAFLGGAHSRASTEPSSDRSLPIPGRLGELIAVFESQSPSMSHSRSTSTPGYRASSPMFGTVESAGSGYGYGSTSFSRPSSPSKSGSGFSGTYTGPETRSSLLSPPVRPTTSGPRSFTIGTRTDTPSYTTPSYTTTPSGFSNSITHTGSYTTPNTEAKTFTGTEDTYTRSTVTPSSILRKPQSTARSPIDTIDTVRNIVTLWKQRTPAATRTEKSSVSPSSPPPLPGHDDGLYRIRRRVEGVSARLRESRGAGPSNVTPVRPPSQEAADTASIKSVKSGNSGVFPPGFDLNEFSSYARSKEPVSDFFCLGGSVFMLCTVAHTYRFIMVSERSRFTSLPLATVPSSFVSSYPPPLLACSRWRKRNSCTRSPQLH